jgi:hypothetical protein
MVFIPLQKNADFSDGFFTLLEDGIHCITG